MSRPGRVYARWTAKWEKKNTQISQGRREGSEKREEGRVELQCSRRCDASTAVRVIHVGRLARSYDKDNV
jgi:hypothetical protein